MAISQTPSVQNRVWPRETRYEAGAAWQQSNVIISLVIISLVYPSVIDNIPTLLYGILSMLASTGRCTDECSF